MAPMAHAHVHARTHAHLVRSPALAWRGFVVGALASFLPCFLAGWSSTSLRSGWRESSTPPSGHRRRSSTRPPRCSTRYCAARATPFAMPPPLPNPPTSTACLALPLSLPSTLSSSTPLALLTHQHPQRASPLASLLSPLSSLSSLSPRPCSPRLAARLSPQDGDGDLDDDDIDELFDECDTDGSGTVSLEELTGALAKRLNAAYAAYLWSSSTHRPARRPAREFRPSLS